MDSRCTKFFGIRLSVLAMAALAYGAVGAGCKSDKDSGGSSCPVGQEGCPCTPGGSCDRGLTCYSDLCVVDNGGSTGGRGQVGAGGDGADTGGNDSGRAGGSGMAGDGAGGDGGGGNATSGAAGQPAGGTTGASGNGGDGTGVVTGQGGEGGSGEAPALQYLECTGDECCLTNCFSQSTCGTREFTGCTDDLCGTTSASPCNEDVLTLPEWFGPRECVLNWIEGDLEMGSVHVFAYCPCENAGSQVLMEEVLFEVTSEFDGTCDFSSAPEPACELDYSECP